MPDFTRELREEKSYFADVKKHILKESKNLRCCVNVFAMAKLWALSNAQPIQLNEGMYISMSGINPLLVVGDGAEKCC